MTVANKLRGACVGFGFISSRGHAPSYQQRSVEPADFEIVAIADICRERQVEAHRQFPKARIYGSWEELLQREQGNLDFVDITTPPYAHAEIANRALGCGLHVLCEKPIAATPTQALSMAEQAARVKRVLFPCHNYRHAPVVKSVRRLLANGAIGEVRLITLQTFRPTHARGVVEWHPDWRRERRYSGGGIAMDHGSHTFYLAFEWMRSYPTSITAKATTLGSFDTEDNLSCTLSFPTGVATAHLTWTAGARRVLYTLHGSRGSIIVEDDDVRLLGDANQTDSSVDGSPSIITAPSHWMDASHKDWFSSLLDDFRAAIDSRQWVSRDTVDALTCMNTIHAAYGSASHGSQEMPIEDALRQLRVGVRPARKQDSNTTLSMSES
jgi:predicted dehydrogenase